MENGRPSERGILEVADDAGAVINDVNRLRLGPGLSMSRNPSDPSIVIDTIASLVSSVVVVNSAVALRSFALIPDSDKLYYTKGGAAANDGGHWWYKWNPSDTSTDDGVLHLKISSRTVGRFNPIRTPDGMYNALSAVPAASDGSRSVSFDPSYGVAIGSELARVTKILRDSGWSGIAFGADASGNRTYKCAGTEGIGFSSAPFVPFTVELTHGAQFKADPSAVTITAAPIIVYADFEISILSGSAYGTRTWTQTIGGGERSFSNVADITGLVVGDWMLMRIGADKTDASGAPFVIFCAQIKSITPGTGTTGTIETWQSVPEECPTGVGINLFRTQTLHDMVKMTGFQDNTKIRAGDGAFYDVSINPIAVRNMEFSGGWEQAKNFGLNCLYCFSMDVGRFFVGRAVGSPSVPGNLITLAKNYDTRIRSYILSDIAPQSSGFVQALSEELGCRGTRIDFADITYNASGAAAAVVLFCTQTPGQYNSISIGTLLLRGGVGTIQMSPNVHCDYVENRCPVASGSIFRLDLTDAYYFNGVYFSGSLKTESTIPVRASSVVSHTMRVHGMTRSMRVKASSVTGITKFELTQSGGIVYTDLVGSLVAGQWVDLNQATVQGVTFPNQVGYGHLTIRITTDGTVPAGSGISIIHDVFQTTLAEGSSATVTDTSYSSTWLPTARQRQTLILLVKTASILLIQRGTSQ